jgi:hypothetical protein
VDSGPQVKPLVSPDRLFQVPQRLYDSEIDGKIDWCFDGGFTWTLYGSKESPAGEAGTYAEALIALAHAAAERSHDGTFAKWWGEK